MPFLMLQVCCCCRDVEIPAAAQCPGCPASGQQCPEASGLLLELKPACCACCMGNQLAMLSALPRDPGAQPGGALDADHGMPQVGTAGRGPKIRAWAGAGLMKTVGANKDAPVPLRLFEASDVVLPTPDSSTGSTNSRRLAAVHVARESGFEIIHGLLNRLMEKLGVEVAGTGFLRSQVLCSASCSLLGFSQMRLSTCHTGLMSCCCSCRLAVLFSASKSLGLDVDSIGGWLKGCALCPRLP